MIASTSTSTYYSTRTYSTSTTNRNRTSPTRMSTCTNECCYYYAMKQWYVMHLRWCPHSTSHSSLFCSSLFCPGAVESVPFLSRILLVWAVLGCNGALHSSMVGPARGGRATAYRQMCAYDLGIYENSTPIETFTNS